MMSENAAADRKELGKKQTFLRPYSPPAWAAQLKGVPKMKVELAVLNTPIHEWNLPGLPDGFSVSIKRDDVTGSSLSGNKIRKLEFLLADALNKGCRHVITCGALNSNHCRAVTVSARQMGLTPHLILKTDAADASDITSKSNLLLIQLCGAHLYLVPKESPYLTHLVPRMERLAQEIKASYGEDAYVISMGGSDGLGLFGYISAFEELRQQGVLENFDDVVFACGSAGTASGLAVGNYLTGSKLRIHGIAVSEISSSHYQLVNKTLCDVGLGHLKSEDLFRLVEREGYSASSEKELEFISKVAIASGVILDSTYTSKAVLNMIQEMADSPDSFKGRRVLFVHTGGIFGLFDGRMGQFLQHRPELLPPVKMWPDVNSGPI